MPADVARALKGRRVGKGKWMARCPAHREKTGSLSITDMRNGKTRLHCFGGCVQADVLRAVGLSWKDLRPDGEVAPEIKGRLADEENLERLEARHFFMWWLSRIEPGKRRYWEAAMQRVREEMEPLYWEVMPDKERFDRVREWELKDYRAKRMDWLRRQHGGDTSGSAERVAKQVR